MELKCKASKFYQRTGKRRDKTTAERRHQGWELVVLAWTEACIIMPCRNKKMHTTPGQQRRIQNKQAVGMVVGPPFLNRLDRLAAVTIGTLDMVSMSTGTLFDRERTV